MALFVVLLLLAGCSGGEVYYFLASRTGQAVGPFPDQQTCQEIRAEVDRHAYVSSCWKGR